MDPVLAVRDQIRRTEERDQDDDQAAGRGRRPIAHEPGGPPHADDHASAPIEQEPPLTWPCEAAHRVPESPSGADPCPATTQEGPLGQLRLRRWLARAYDHPLGDRAAGDRRPSPWWELDRRGGVGPLEARPEDRRRGRCACGPPGIPPGPHWWVGRDRRPRGGPAL